MAQQHVPQFEWTQGVIKSLTHCKDCGVSLLPGDDCCFKDSREEDKRQEIACLVCNGINSYCAIERRHRKKK